MARQRNSEILGRYRDKIDQSRRWRRDERYDQLWRRMIDLYKGKHYDELTEEDRLVVNICFSTINVIAPSISVNHPKITVGARKPEDGDRAIITEAIVNYWWRHYDCQQQLRRAVDDYLVVGHGWLKVGYRFVEEEKLVNPDAGVEHTDTVDPNQGFSEETEIVVTEDRPFVERISPFDVFVDPDATSMDDVTWIAHRVRRPLMEVKNDTRYNRQARLDAQPSSWSKWEADGDRKNPARHNDNGYVDVWEFYDVRKGTVAIFCDGADNFLISPMKLEYGFAHPFVMLRNYDVPENFYPMGELESIEPLQYELNATRTQMINHRKRFSRKWLYRESAFDAHGRAALESDEDNVMVPVVGDEQLGGVVAPMPAIVNPPDMYNVSSTIVQDIDRISGVAEFMRGGVSEINRTATEAAMIQDAANARTSDKLAAVEAVIAQCAKRLIGLAQQFMTGEQVVRVVGSSAMPIWVTFDRDYILGEFDFEVEAGSTQPVNESFRRQMALQMVDALAPFIQFGVVDVSALARHILQFGFGVKTPDAFLSQQAQQAMPGQEQAAPQGPPQAGGEQIDPAALQAMMQQQQQVPTGGMPMPSSIPPGVLSALQNQVGLPNTQM